MRLGWLALPLLIALEACAPVRTMQEAARTLRFTLDRVEPRFQLAFPLDRSRLALQITMAVDNPSQVPFHLEGFQGRLRLEGPSAALPLGEVQLVRPMELAPCGKALLTVEVSFFYSDLQANWGALQAALRPGAAGAWGLEGHLGLRAAGIAWQVPVKTRRSYGGAP